MPIRPEKIDLLRRQQRFYAMPVVQTLFDKWCLVREWERISDKGGQRLVDYVASKAEAETALKKRSAQKIKRGYWKC